MQSGQANNPTVIMVGGPNGAGKSTIGPHLVRDTFGEIEFVDADIIARGLSAFDPDRRAFAAGRVMLRHLDDLAKARRDFAFETTLASRTFAPFLRRLAGEGYQCHLRYVWIQSADIAVRRVRARVAAGGHTVPEETIRRRFVRSARNLLDLYLPLMASWEVLDNTGPRLPTSVATGGAGEDTIIVNKVLWRRLKEFGT